MKNVVIGVFIALFIIFSCIASYALGVESAKSKQPNDIEETKEVIISDELIAEIREQYKDEIEQQLRDDLYVEIKNEVINEVQSNISEQILILQEQEAQRLEEEQLTLELENNTNENTKPKQIEPYIKVHDVTVSASSGTKGLEEAIKSAVDSCSGTVEANANSVTGLGTFPIYWNSTDGVSVTSYITVTP